jgi:2-hydroxycyclohexanecarboxyl-CoA dehydrogenase
MSDSPLTQASPAPNASLFRLDGCVAIVTGAGRGMGRGVAETLARQGATVAINDFFPERAEAAAAELRAAGLKALAAPADVTDYEAVQKMVAAVREQAGIVDIYVSNAGVPTSGMGYGKFIESKPEDWERFVKLNMYGLMNGCHAVLPGMIENKWGRIVAITSESWRAAVPMGIAAYAASKAGVVGFVRQIAAEVGRKGVNVNALSLGTMNNWEGSEELARKNCIIARAGSPADVGAGVAWLASREAEWVTGQIVPLNGGGITA